MISNVLTFSSKETSNGTAAETTVTIGKVLELKLKALIARARIACQNMSPRQAEGLEKQAMANFLESQKSSTPEIDLAISCLDHKSFQSYAIQIAVLVSKGDFESAAELLQATIENFSRMIGTLFTSAQETETHLLAAA